MKLSLFFKTVLIWLMANSFLGIDLNAQSVDLQWAKSVGGIGNNNGREITTDSIGNVYITGRYYGNGGLDFDPGVDSAFLPFYGADDIFIAKYDSSGNYIWAIGMGGIGDDWGWSIDIDNDGNVYVVGQFENTADFDPGAGVANLVSVGVRSIFFAKYDAAGNYLWAKSIGNGWGYGTALELDGFGNIHVTGYFGDSADFDPGPGVEMLVALGSKDFFFAKYDSSGSYIWAHRFGSASIGDVAYDVTVDLIGNVYITGNTLSADFDPGPDTLIISGSGGAFFAKYNSNGDLVWAKKVGSSSSSTGNGIAVDDLGNVYVTGFWQGGTADFDPNSGQALFTSVGLREMFVAKYDSLGQYKWANSIASEWQDWGKEIAIDGVGNVFVTGPFGDTADFDPGIDTANLIPFGNQDIFVAKYDGNGNYLWAANIGDTDYDEGFGIEVGADGSFYITGYFQLTADFDLGPGTSNLTTVGRGIYFAKYRDCSFNPIILTGSGDSLICNGTSNGIVSVTANGGNPPYSYLWSNTSTVDTITALSAGTYIVTVTDSANCYVMDSVAVQSAPLLQDSLSINICDVDSILLQGAYQNISGIYTDTLVSVNSCDSIVHTVLTVNSSYAVQDSGVSVCNGDSALIYGAFRTASGVYYDSLFTIAGCDSIFSTTLSLDSVYNLTIAYDLCNGDSFFVGGSYQTGGGTYVDSLQSVNGCDSVISTTLSLDSTYSLPIAYDLCNGDSFFVGGSYQTGSGTYVDSLQSVNGCDSIISTTLSLDSTYFFTMAYNICDGDSFFVGGSYQTGGGTYVDSLQSVNGCDSVISTTLSLDSTYNLSIAHSICAGDSFLVGGSFQSIAGTYYDSLSTDAGCDSIHSTVLSVISTFIITAPNDTICGGDSILIAGTYQYTPGTYIDSLTALGGCDSIISYTLIVNQTYSVSEPDMEICSGDSALIYGAYRNTAATFYDSLTTVNGCDSTFSTALLIDQIPNVIFNSLDSSYIVTDPPVTMTGSPPGGAFSATDGVAGDEFFPSTGVGTYMITYTYTDSSGCINSDSQSVSVVPVVPGILEQVGAQQLAIYPNPNTGKFTVEISMVNGGALELQVINSLGQEILATKIKHKQGVYSHSLDLSEYGSGIYTVKIVTKEGSIQRQVVIE